MNFLFVKFKSIKMINREIFKKKFGDINCNSFAVNFNLLTQVHSKNFEKANLQ